MCLIWMTSNYSPRQKIFEFLVHVTHTFSDAMGIQCIFQKCASVVLRHGKLCSCSGLTLPAYRESTYQHAVDFLCCIGNDQYISYH